MTDKAPDETDRDEVVRSTLYNANLNIPMPRWRAPTERDHIVRSTLYNADLDIPMPRPAAVTRQPDPDRPRPHRTPSSPLFIPDDSAFSER